jgi:DNA-binding Xre family transcriptional regulator
MLKLNCDNVFKLRNINNPFTFLRKNGFSHAIAQKLTSKNPEYIKMRDLYQLCKVLYCTPNDGYFGLTMPPISV